MTPASDPYRTLGLARGASLDEVKRAYRALAKANHPDAAGPTALPRWLAIQAAYEQLLRGPNPARVRMSPSRSAAADPDRADATHRAYGGRPRRSRSTPGGGDAGRAGGTAAGPAGPGSRAGSTGSTGSTGRRRPSSSTGPAADRDQGGDSPRGGRGRNKATLGSTSYDGADSGPFEPDWGGASWYGTTSGTYWTINPKEYADPRKHGPEYQARARRAAAGRRSGSGDVTTPDDASSPGDVRDVGSPATADPAAPGRSTRARAPVDPSAGAVPDEPVPSHTTSSWWRSTAGPTGAPLDVDGATERPGSRPAATGRPSQGPSRTGLPAPPPDLAAAATDLGRALTDERTAYGRWRLVQAVVGWLPLVFGLAWLIGELTGCGRFAATCDGGVSALTPVLGVAALVVLLLVRSLAALAAAGAVALVVAAVPTSLLLSATGEAANVESRNALLGVVLVIAWIAGLGIGLARRLRATEAPSGRAGPVS